MSWWRYLAICAMLYFTGYINARTWWANILHLDRNAPLWPLILALVVMAWMLWMMWKEGAQSG